MTTTPTSDRTAELMVLGQIHGIVQGLYTNVCIIFSGMK
jgi:hypothetical protein